MKVILTEKISKLGNIGDTVEVKTGFARNYLIPNKKAIRFSKENMIKFEQEKEELINKEKAIKELAESRVKDVQQAKIYMIRQAGDTGQLYGSVSTRDISKKLTEILQFNIESSQILLKTPIKTIGVFETNVSLHPDVLVPIKIYVAQSDAEIKALIEGKSLKEEKQNEKVEDNTSNK